MYYNDYLVFTNEEISDRIIHSREFSIETRNWNLNGILIVAATARQCINLINN